MEKMRFLWLKCVFVVKNAFFKKWSEVGKMGENGGKKPGAKSPIPYYSPSLVILCYHHRLIGIAFQIYTFRLKTPRSLRYSVP